VPSPGFPLPGWLDSAVAVWLVARGFDPLVVGAPAAVLAWLVGRGWRRREARRRAGRCERCAYDLTGNVSRVCPECGMAAGAGHVSGAAKGEH
jgi:hypothetical protein